MHSFENMRWDRNCLRLNSGRRLATIEPDGDWPGLWRVHMPDGRITDMVNRTRAKDAAIALASAVLNNGRQRRGDVGLTG
jgi:hypothetical protein